MAIRLFRDQAAGLPEKQEQRTTARQGSHDKKNNLARNG
jgi:hypothetical protein